jgi:hypothetical protein
MRTLISVFFGLTLPVLAAQPRCKGNPKVISACYTVHARARYGNGTPQMRLWVVGTKRILGVTAGPIADDYDGQIAPYSLSFSEDIDSIYGDFEVCPFTPDRPGVMRMVCIESASHLVKKRYPLPK